MSIEELRRWANGLVEEAEEKLGELEEYDEDLYNEVRDIFEAAQTVSQLCDEHEPAELDFG